MVTTGSAITKNIILPSATYTTDWARPNLTANGTLGGDSFAVAASSEYSSTYAAYNAVRTTSGTSYSWRTSSITECTYTMYNPDNLKVSSITIVYTGATYVPSTLTVDGSDDGESWVSLPSTYSLSSTTGTLTITTPSPYKYYRLNFTRSSAGYIRVYRITPTALEKDTTDLGVL